jgi:acetyl-CoA carboxylase carboxyl transferase subunit alpha
MRTYLSFETAVADIDARLDELRAVVEKGDSPALAEEIAKLEAKSEKALADLYATLTPWQKTQVARVQGRPRFGDYLKGLVTEFTPLAGDRYFGEDEAIVGGLGRFDGEAVCVIGQEKGNDTESRLRHNFGMARPEGYRKAVRLMDLAEKFDLPVIALVDTAGAFPGVEAEARGQAEAIARSTVAIATANKVLMLEHAIYTVASPEASASILWRDSSRAQDAATSMKITAQDLIKFGIIDGVIAEPVGGAHRDPAAAVAATGRAIGEALKSLQNMSPDALREARAEKFLAIGRKV